MKFDFDTPVDRRGSWCTQWDYVQDRFGIKNLLPFTISDMDFKTAPCIVKALEKRLAHGVLGYSRWQNKEYLHAIYHWYKTQFCTTVNLEHIVYGPSVIYQIAKIMQIWSEPGDEVVLHTPAYNAFYHMIEGNARKVAALPLHKKGHHWFVDPGQLELLLARPKAKILLLCSPQNPTGKVWTERELQHMANLCAKHNVKVISDEIHMDMTWESEHIPWMNVAKSDWALFTSASKSFNIPALTGAYGFINDPKTRTQYLEQLKFNDGLSSPAVLSLIGTIAGYQEGEPWLKALKKYLYANLTYVSNRLNTAFPCLKLVPPESTYLDWLDLRPLQLNDDTLQTELIHGQHVAIMPGSVYDRGGHGFLRLNVGCPRSKVETGVNALIKAIKKLT